MDWSEKRWYRIEISVYFIRKNFVMFFNANDKKRINYSKAHVYKKL